MAHLRVAFSLSPFLQTATKMGIDFLSPQKEKRERETHPISRHNDALFFFLPRGRWGIVFPGIIFAQKERESKRNWLCFFFLPSSSENEQLSLFLLSPPSFSLLFPPFLSSQVAERDSPRLRHFLRPPLGHGGECQRWHLKLVKCGKSHAV